MQVGVGALVVGENNEVLVVNERNALIPNSWKLPGGYLERSKLYEFNITLHQSQIFGLRNLRINHTICLDTGKIEF